MKQIPSEYQVSPYMVFFLIMELKGVIENVNLNVIILYFWPLFILESS